MFEGITQPLGNRQHPLADRQPRKNGVGQMGSGFDHSPGVAIEVIDRLQSTGRRCAVLCHSRLPATPAAYAWRCLPANPRAYASALYAALRELDQADAELIIVEEIPATPAWAAVADRLQRAAAGAGLSTDAADTLG
ncbi:MAG: putative translation factor (SUA5) [Candidatus Accumulibacter phosphatis]|uniref:Putative translation factor (SUA5) n=2 Tax=Candidatus Accumulibacter TaxID=327159 RepID=A0A080M761_9PROT|nr:MAG: putative translation factor (SUA5) [Candidatus Accumulibacter phosphatis]